MQHQRSTEHRRYCADPCRGLPRIEDYKADPREFDGPKGGRRAESIPEGTQLGLVTVITVVRNSASTLARTIDSIRTQSYRHIEYIVIDGRSTDGTLELLRQREADIDLWISEPDRGISDAFNKGIALAAGEFIALVNGDDWLEPDHIAQSVECLNRTGADFSYANLTLHDPSGAPLYSIFGDVHYSRRIVHAMPAMNHPTIVCRRTLYTRNGLYDPSYRIAMDYEWLLRNHFRGAIAEYIPNLTSHMGADGVSQRHIRASLLEVRRASISHGYPASFAFLRFHARLLKARSRLILEKVFRPRVVDALHRLINRNFRRADFRKTASH